MNLDSCIDLEDINEGESYLANFTTKYKTSNIFKGTIGACSGEGQWNLVDLNEILDLVEVESND